ncbi:MAG: HEAT repeat domain-containing protein [Planctomycetes bacterium]|nr:HEAT repeat domain-containing protein [Planctomycetota bacterium]
MPVPATGGPTGPTAGGPAAPGAAGPTTGPGGIVIEEDFTAWHYWWEFNKNPYLALRAQARGAVQSGSDDFYLGATRRPAATGLERVSADQAIQLVLPALKKAIDGTEQRDVTSACLVAMAKIGLDHPQFELVDVFSQRLQRADQEVRETAALALGVAGQADERALSLLEGLARDDSIGRAARGGDVDGRTRAFALYGLGLCARDCDDVAVKQRAFAVARDLLQQRGLADRNVRVAAVQACGLLAADGRDYHSARLRDEARRLLQDYFVASLGAGEEWVQAHCPTALARLASERERPALRQLLLGELTVRRERQRGNVVTQSCAIALGRLCAPFVEAASEDAEASRALLEVAREHPDAMTRYFALMSLARIGGAQNRAALLKEFDRARKSQHKPWCALALGVLAHTAHRDGHAADRLIVDTLRDELDDARAPELVGALGIGLGLAGGVEASAAMLDRLRSDVQKERMAGYLCIGLALLGDPAVVPELRAVVAVAGRRPQLLLQAARALGRLGDQGVTPLLIERMTGDGANLVVLAACSSALGQIGDRRSLEPLLAMLADKSLGSLPRAFAAAALGGVCDRRDLPWNTPIMVDVNYRASVETLTDQRAGVLDLL